MNTQSFPTPPFTFLARLFFFVQLLLATAFVAHGQTEDLRQDADFFRQQTATYQRWLDHSGLGQYLRVYDVKVEAAELSLYLAFPFSDVDSVQTAWEVLKTQFEASAAITIEQQLFYKAQAIMEVRQSNISVQIYDTYDLRSEPLFMRAIYFGNGQVQTAESNPKSKRRTINMQPAKVGSGKDNATAAFKEKYTREHVYECLLQYAKTRFERTTCDGRNPRVRMLENDDNLRFEVSDLCREVLTDEANPTLCAILSNFGYDCNWVKRELLVFTVTYEDTTTGFRLVMEIDGKYGSGFYTSVRRGGYLSMEIDFDEYLENYASEMGTELRRVLQNCK